jgi:hypothetical protein
MLKILVPLRRRVYSLGSRFPEIATTSLGVFQSWPLPHSSRLVFPEIQALHEHRALRFIQRTPAANPRRIPRNAEPSINPVAGDAHVRFGAAGVRRDARCARERAFSVANRQRPVCAVEHALKCVAMPFKSQAQRRKFAELLVQGKISPQTFEEWNRETGGKRLPERVKRKTKSAGKRKRR